MSRLNQTEARNAVTVAEFREARECGQDHRSYRADMHRAQRRYGRELIRAEATDYDYQCERFEWCDCDFCYPPLRATPGDMDYVRAFPSSPVMTR